MSKKQPCTCPLNKECFGKKKNRHFCYILTEPALHTTMGKTDCAFRKSQREKCS